MQIGALLGPILAPEQTQFLAQQAQSYEAAGFSSLWMAQAIGRGFFMPDPLLALAVAATATQKVNLGTAVLQVPLYQPMDLAHRVFSLQQVCGTRLILGVGAGSTQADFDACGGDYANRFKSFNQHLDTLRTIFASGKTDSNDLSPWPHVLGGPPLYFGTWGKGVERAATEFDGWIASGAYRTVDEVCAALGRYREQGGGRAIVSTLQIGADTDLGEFREKLARYAEAGFDDAVIMRLPGAPEAPEIRAWID